MYIFQELDVVMDDKIWIADGRINSDFEIPPSIQFTCNGKPIFGMRPMTDADFMIPEMDDDDMMGTLNIGDDYKDDHPDYDVEKRVSFVLRSLEVFFGFDARRCYHCECDLGQGTKLYTW